MSRRLLLFALGLVVALSGVGAVHAYASGADARAAGNQKLAAVLVTNETVEAASTLAELAQRVETKMMPAGLIPVGALTALPDDAGLVVSRELAAGEVLLPALLVRQAELRSGGDALLSIPEGKAAMSVELEDKQRVGRFVRPGDWVAVYASADDGSGTRLLFPRAQVLAVGPTSVVGTQEPVADVRQASETDAQAVPTTVLTLAIGLTEGALLAHASENGALTFALQTDSTTTDTARKPVTHQDVFGVPAGGQR